MSQRQLTVDICVLGAGAGGLSVAAGAAQLGLSVVLYEEADMGGDCLNTGCVPSKALIAAAKTVHAMAHASRYGIENVSAKVNWNQVRGHIGGVIETIAPIDSQERFEGLGCIVLREHARFTGPDTVESATAVVKAQKFVIATGATAAVPPIPGLAETPFLTNETVFAQDDLPDSLIVLGGGVIGVELGQAFARLGSKVSLIEAFSLLGGQEEDAVACVRDSLNRDGVTVIEGAKAVGVTGSSTSVAVSLEDGRVIKAQRLLVAVGRAARVDNLGLEKANIAFTRKGVTTDHRLRSTTNPRVWAVGDVAGKQQLTHAAGFHASVFIRNAVFKAPATAEVSHMPAVAYCDPEFARIGLSEADARKQFGSAVTVTQVPFHDNDRAQAERATAGFCKLVVGKGAKILGATIVGEGAGEAIQLVGLAMANKLGVGAITAMIAPYPTRGEIVKRAAGAYYTPTLFSDRTRALVKFLKLLG